MAKLFSKKSNKESRKTGSDGFNPTAIVEFIKARCNYHSRPNWPSRKFPGFMLSLFVKVFPFADARLPVQFTAMSHEYVLKPFTPEISLQIDYARELNPTAARRRHRAARPGARHRRRGFGQDAHAHLSRRVSAGAGDSRRPHFAAHVHEQGRRRNDAARLRSARPRTALALGRHVSFHRRADFAAARRHARLPARFHHPRPRRREGFDQGVHGGRAD